MKLLSVNIDAKTIKGMSKGILTGILYLAPHTSSGASTSICRYSTRGCREACLYTAGRAGAVPAINAARVRRTLMWLDDFGDDDDDDDDEDTPPRRRPGRQVFLDMLYDDIYALKRKALREGFTPAVRLNGTSDIRWERHTNIMRDFSDIQFYDYTKWPLNMVGPANSSWESYSESGQYGTPPNYHLTYSLAEGPYSREHAMEWLRAGRNVAVVFRTKELVAEAIRNGYMGYRAIDGDETDCRFLDPPGPLIVALKAKGRAKNDTRGFVRRTVSALPIVEDANA